MALTCGVCLNCVSYDTRAAHQCRDRRAEPEAEKAVGNFCEFFEFARSVAPRKPSRTVNQPTVLSANPFHQVNIHISNVPFVSKMFLCELNPG
jgi:hypothetical protein